MPSKRRTRSVPPARQRPRRAAWLLLAGAAAAAGIIYVSIRPSSTIPTAQSVGSASAASAAVPTHGYEIVRAYPHDSDAFTQGLLFRDGFLYESTGLEGRSSLRQVDLETGRVVRQRNVDSRYFAEGLTDWRGQLLQLTYTSNIGFVYDLATFEPRSTFSYRGEGWGLTHDGTHLIMSDGSAVLRVLDPVTKEERRRLPVRDRGSPVENLNELEFVKGTIYANIWHADRVAVIHPDSGAVTAWIDLAGLRPASANHPEAVLNGIAHDPVADRLFVTGKLWPQLFEIRVRP